ncbi:hypothetical protein [Streptomyces atratus]|uniref:hypothetical protein n=1 Tax=Streptomyces atratus TaxID=1893 RepID=UPI00365F5D52
MVVLGYAVLTHRIDDTALGDLRQFGGHHRGLDVVQQAEQVLGVVLVESRGRLVEDEQLHVLCELLGGLRELLLADADALDQRVGIFPEPDLFHQLQRPAPGGLPVDPARLRDSLPRARTTPTPNSTSGVAGADASVFISVPL